MQVISEIMINNECPRIDPCGIPNGIDVRLDVNVYKTMALLLFIIYIRGKPAQ